MKKRSISLIEIVISLGLLSILLTTLFFWYGTLNKQKEEFNTLKWPLMEERYAHQRLHSILSKAETPFFTTSQEGDLVFIFDRGPAVNPQLSGQVLARLYYDAAHQTLCLGIWPYPKDNDPITTPCKTTILLDRVSKCTFQFYSPPDPFKKTVDPEEVGRSRPKEGWNGGWKTEYNSLPAFIKIHIKRNQSKGVKDRSFDYLFDLPIPVVYAQEMV